MANMLRLLCPVGWVLFVVLVAPVAAAPPAELARWFMPQAWERDVDAPIVSLGKPGEFDDQHIFAPAGIEEEGRYRLWYSGSSGAPNNRVFRLGLAESSDGKQFEKSSKNPVFEYGDGAHSVLTAGLLRSGDGRVLREDGKLRMWFTAATLGKGGLHTLHETTSVDGVEWTKPSPVLLENAYCPTVLKTEAGYEMWFSDVSRRPWLIRHASSTDGTVWKVTERPAVRLNQGWEGEVLVYPTVLKIDGAYLMWYGSYFSATRRETTAIGFAVSSDGRKWHKHPQNPVFRPDPAREWESNYVGSGSVMRLADGSFRYWYASRKAPPFLNLYFAINTARWAGPTSDGGSAKPVARLRLPPENGDSGVLAPADPRLGPPVDVLEIVDEKNAIVRAWYVPAELPGGAEVDPDDAAFVDLWLQHIDTAGIDVADAAAFRQAFRVVGSKTFRTDCGGRSLPLLEPAGP